jgi:hypothetical protein
MEDFDAWGEEVSLFEVCSCDLIIYFIFCHEPGCSAAASVISGHTHSSSARLSVAFSPIGIQKTPTTKLIKRTRVCLELNMSWY